MPYDLIIKNGTVVDGSGLLRYRGDVAVKNGRIAAVGKVEGPSARVIDAEGKIVAPGFVDIHTHYDAQLFWDPHLTCSPWHGVTTVVMGNCSFSLAPCRKRDRDFVVGVLAKVERMNRELVAGGIDWQWESFPDFLRRVESAKLGINVAACVGHTAIRRYVLGEAASHRPATEDEVRQMKLQAREAMAAGAFGFTTSFSAGHVDWDGAPIPSRLADHNEVLEIASALAESGIGSVELTGPRSSKTAPGGVDEDDARLMTQASLRTGRPVNWNEMSFSWEEPEAWKQQLQFMERASAQGARVYGVLRNERVDIAFTLNSPGGLLRLCGAGWPKWAEVLSVPAPERPALLRDPRVRAALKADVQRADPGKLAYLRLANLALTRSKTGKYTEHLGLTLGEIGRRLGKDPVDVLVDCSLEEGLDAEFAFVGRRNGDIAAVAHMLKSPYVIAGVSDAGTDTDQLNTCSYTTNLLARWARDERLLTLEEAVRQLTLIPASVYGLRDRGLLQPGMAADIVVFDYDKLKALPTERVSDFPGGVPRMIVRGQGYEHLIVNGQAVFEGGNRPTGALPGRLIKSSDYRQA